MTNHAEFDQLVRDALANLHDYASLETHPLAAILPAVDDEDGSRGQRLRGTLLEAIERLRPPEPSRSLPATVWRPHQILSGRYVEKISLEELQCRLSLSGRQLRREQSKALQAIASLLWDGLTPAQQASFQGRRQNVPGGPPDQPAPVFVVNRDSLDLSEVLDSVFRLFRRRMESEGVALRLALPADLPPVLSDRVVLRQILFCLLDYALLTHSEGPLTIEAGVDAGQVTLLVRFDVDEPSSLDIEDEALGSARYWIAQLNAELRLDGSAETAAGPASLALALPRARRPIMLVVDDQAAVVRLFQRYLGRTGMQVTGLQDGTQVLEVARHLRPGVIALDIMMPSVDGWDTLQALQADPFTRSIPVIICSVWDDPGLSSLLGAVSFLKKPVTQGDLLAVLGRLGLLDRPAGSHPGCPSTSSAAPPGPKDDAA